MATQSVSKGHGAQRLSLLRIQPFFAGEASRIVCLAMLSSMGYQGGGVAGGSIRRTAKCPVQSEISIRTYWNDFNPHDSFELDNDKSWDIFEMFFFFFEFRNSQIKTIKSRWKSWCSEYQNFYLVSSNSYTFLLDSLAVSFTSSSWQHGKLLANRKSPLSLTPTAVLCVKWCNPVFGFLGKQNLIECNCICSRLQVNSYRPICDSWNHGFFFFFFDLPPVAPPTH